MTHADNTAAMFFITTAAQTNLSIKNMNVHLCENDNKKKMMISSFLSFIKVSKVLPLMGKCVAKWLKSWNVDIILIIFVDKKLF